jgi:predicted porin
MKKFLLALAIAGTALAAQAQTNVAVYGRMAAFANSVTTNGVDAGSTLSSDSSRIGFRAREELGNGLSANAVIETNVYMNSPDTGNDTKLGDRTSTLGLAKAGLGTLDMGRAFHATYRAMNDIDPFNTRIGSINGDINNLRGQRASNAVFLSVTAIPNMVVSYDRGVTNNATVVPAGQPDLQAFSVQGNVGPATLAYGRFEQGIEKTDFYSARAKFGGTTVGAGYSDNHGAVATRGYLVTAAHEIAGTPFTVKGSYGQVQDLQRAYNVGVDYAFSKKTSAHVIYRNVDKRTSTTAQDVQQVAVGLAMNF